MYTPALDLSARPSLSFRYNRSAHLRTIARESEDPVLLRTDAANAHLHQNLVRSEMVRRGIKPRGRRRVRKGA